jgi:hypothetical protein
MPMKKYKPEQIVTLLRQIELEIACRVHVDAFQVSSLEARSATTCPHSSTSAWRIWAVPTLPGFSSFTATFFLHFSQ